jgi:hypothetical protein
MEIEVRPAIGRWDDFASFMMPRKPGGRGCVCMVYRNSSLDMPGRIAYMRALCDSEPVGCQKFAWPVSCSDGLGQVCGMMIDRVLAPALSHLRPALRLAGPARPVIGF